MDGELLSIRPATDAGNNPTSSPNGKEKANSSRRQSNTLDDPEMFADTINTKVERGYIYPKRILWEKEKGFLFVWA